MRLRGASLPDEPWFLPKSNVRRIGVWSAQRLFHGPGVYEKIMTSQIKEIDAEALGQLLCGDPARRPVLIDVRTPHEFSQGRLAGAELIPLHLLPVRQHDIPADRMVVLYCRSGARSAQGCAYLSAQGMGEVVNLRGGIIAWVRSGLAVE